MQALPFVAGCCLLATVSQVVPLRAQESDAWNQWRGPNRDGSVSGADWPDSLSEEVLRKQWRVELPPSYSGPVVSERAVFVTGTQDAEKEVVYALDRETGQELWKAEWDGAMTVPFFAASNGSWIRATPVYDGESLFVAGMRDVLVALNAETGERRWRVDFVDRFGTPLPAFGCASSPALDGDFLYVQAGASVVKLDKRTGETVWRTLQDGGGMTGGAFSSPTIATLAGQRQLLVQTREELAGVDLETGAVLWKRTVPSFRGMNILTPVAFGDGVFTSSYRNKSWFFDITKPDGAFETSERWKVNVQGYMSTPVVVEGHVYIHLQNQRFACIELGKGETTWTSEPFGRYCSLVRQADRILALDQEGELLLLKADPNAFELLDRRKISEQETWAHLAVSGDELFVRELNALSAFEWNRTPEK